MKQYTASAKTCILAAWECHLVLEPEPSVLGHIDSNELFKKKKKKHPHSHVFSSLVAALLKIPLFGTTDGISLPAFS